MRRFLLIAFTLLATSASGYALAAAASGPKSLGVFDFWRAFSATENGQPVCYMSLTGVAPKPAALKKSANKKEKLLKRSNITIMITHRPSEGSKDVVSYSAGAKLRPASEARIVIGKKEFILFTQDETAWSRDAVTDHALAEAIVSSSSMTFNGETVNGDKFSDTITLKGSAKAYKAISKACGLPVKEDPPAAKAKATPAKSAAPKPKSAAKTSKKSSTKQ